MANQRVFLIKRLLTIVVAVFFSTSYLNSAFGGERRVLAQVTVKEGYDSNINWSAGNRKSDWIFTISPDIRGEYETERTLLIMQARIDLSEYSRHDEHNIHNELYTVKYDTYLASPLKGSLEGSFLKDSTLESELEETGIVYTRTGRQRYTFEPRVTWFCSERSQIGLSYHYSGISYDSDSFIDYQTKGINLLLHHQMHDELTSLIWEGSYAQYTYDTLYGQYTDNYYSMFGIEYQIEESLKISCSTGARNSQTNTRKARGINSGQRRETGGIGSVTVEYENPRASATLSYNKDIAPSGTYGVLTKDRISFSTGYRFSETLSGRLFITWTRSKAKDDFYGASQEIEEEYLVYGPSLHYRVFENLNLDLNYQSNLGTKKRGETSPGIDEERRRDVFFLRLTFNHKYMQ